MNKKPKKIFHKDKEKEKLNKILKDKFKNKQEKICELPQTITQISPTKSKINTETKKYNRKLKVHNSICSKEEVKKKINNIQIRNRNSKLNRISSSTNNKSNKLFLSNYLFLTNDTNNLEKQKDKKIKKNKNIKNHKNEEKINLPQLNSDFKKNMLKKTIIIDYEGNNNLNLNLPKGEKDYKKILRQNNNDNDTDNILTSSFNRNTEENSLFDNSSKLYLANLYFNNNDIKGKEEDIKQTLIDKNEEERRLKEYNRIFNLLNTNIEQIKKMFKCNNNNKNVNNNDINKNYNKNDYKENKKIILSNGKYFGRLNSLNKYKANDKVKAKKIKTNLKTNLSEKILSSRNKNSKNNLIIFPFDIKNEYIGDNNIEIYNNNCSFLESSIQDEFYKSLINQSFLQNISHSSFGINSNDISSENNKIGNKKNNDKISLTERKNPVGNNIMRLDINEIYKDENIKNKFRTLILKEKTKNQDNMDKGNTEFKNDNNCKTYSNDIDKNNCIII